MLTNTGVDLIDEQYFIRHPGSEYIQGDVMEVLLSLIQNGIRYDLIICNDIIEHLPDTDLFLKTIDKLCTEGGFVIGSVPNVRYIGNLYELLIKGDWEYKKGGGVLDSTHLRFYTEKSLINTIERSPFSVVKLRGINGFSDHRSVKRTLFYIFLKMMDFICLGKTKDIKFLQFGFLLKRQC